jgi:hypothetical protein
MKVEKSPVRSRESAGGFNMIVPLVLIAVSIACSTSRSVGSQSQASNQPISSAEVPQTSSPTAERTACTLTLAEAPLVNRIKLAMKVEEILALFPGSKEDAELSAAVSKRGAVGNASFPIYPSRYGNVADFKEVSRINFTMLDNKVSSFTVSYNGPEWPHVDKFVEKFVQDKTLPGVDQWEPFVGMDGQMKILTCTGFSIRVFTGGDGENQNYVLVEDVEANNKIKERRKKAREQASPTPAP